MSQKIPAKRTARRRQKTTRKTAATPRRKENKSLPEPWAMALARVKRHIQAGSRHMAG